MFRFVLISFIKEVCYSGDPLATLIQESRSNKSQFVPREKGTTAPYHGKR